MNALSPTEQVIKVFTRTGFFTRVSDDGAAAAFVDKITGLPL